MADREKVLKGLECCSDITVKRRHKCLKECPYDFVKNDNCMEDMARDALELLKEQQETIVSLQGTINKLNAALAEQPEQKHGHWISYGYGQYCCSVCKGYKNMNFVPNYCSTCGAKMDEKMDNMEVKQNETD